MHLCFCTLFAQVLRLLLDNSRCFSVVVVWIYELRRQCGEQFDTLVHCVQPVVCCFLLCVILGVACGLLLDTAFCSCTADIPTFVSRKDLNLDMDSCKNLLFNHVQQLWMRFVSNSLKSGLSLGLPHQLEGRGFILMMVFQPVTQLLKVLIIQGSSCRSLIRKYHGLYCNPNFKFHHS